MQFMRLGDRGQERPMVRDDSGALYDLGGLTGRIDGPFLASGGIERTRDALRSDELRRVTEHAGRVGAPIARPGKVVCIGLNYRDHAAETGASIPAEPIVFFKASNTVIGPDDQVLVPRGSTKTDWEVELAVVIGGVARYLDSPDAAADVIAGYTISNDVSERAFQLERGGQWVKGKSCETFNPLGPYFVPADEIADPQQLRLTLSVNGQVRQNGTTADMIFGVHHLVWYLSQFMVLEPGDIVNTGTPAGVAMGMPDQPFLRAGDVMELEIEGLGKQRQEVGQA